MERLGNKLLIKKSKQNMDLPTKLQGFKKGSTNIEDYILIVHTIGDDLASTCHILDKQTLIYVLIECLSLHSH